MSDTPVRLPARPVSLITIIFLFVLFSAFLFVVRHFYQPTAVAPQNAAADNLTKDLEWKATRQSRLATLAEVREKQLKQQASYGWIDQKAGVVQLPIERAMELTAEKYSANK